MARRLKLTSRVRLDKRRTTSPLCNKQPARPSTPTTFLSSGTNCTVAWFCLPRHMPSCSAWTRRRRLICQVSRRTLTTKTWQHRNQTGGEHLPATKLSSPLMRFSPPVSPLVWSLQTQRNMLNRQRGLSRLSMRKCLPFSRLKKLSSKNPFSSTSVTSRKEMWRRLLRKLITSSQEQHAWVAKNTSTLRHKHVWQSRSLNSGRWKSSAALRTQRKHKHTYRRSSAFLPIRSMLVSSVWVVASVAKRHDRFSSLVSWLLQPTRSADLFVVCSTETKTF